ncbi:MAG: histone deacetylase family protein, partial [Elusimicrobiota bacterium]|nr:histone deacetylase family protein [Elusimicrobiota bacterium]
EKMLFYERMGARPIINTNYDTPIVPNEDNAPYLLFDYIGNRETLKLKVARQIVRAILERRYADIADDKYVNSVVNSFHDDPVKLRASRYVIEDDYTPFPQSVPDKNKIALILNGNHIIHNIRKKAYLEAPQRMSSILKEIEPLNFIKKIEASHFAEKHIKAVHDSDFVDFFKRVSLQTEPEKSIFPYVFPIRNQNRIPLPNEFTAGYYCMDVFTPINKHAYIAAKGAVDCALTGANYVLENDGLAYALVRPPGHHAERKHFGGYCYFNSSSVAAHYLSSHGKVAILDLDFHHGNGHQNIFYDRNDVLTVSIHRDPQYEYPFFSGFEEEKGEEKGKGCNINYPLGEKITGKEYYQVLSDALEKIRAFSPKYLIIPFGLDTSKGDPTASWSLTARDFEKNGLAIGKLKLPTLCVQEGGYNNRILGKNAKFFFTGLWYGKYKKNSGKK